MANILTTVDQKILDILIENKIDEDTKNSFLKLALEYCGALKTDQDYEQQAFQLMTGAETTTQKQCFASLLLRLFGYEKLFWLKESPWRSRVISFLEIQFGQSISNPEIKRGKKQQNHEAAEVITNNVRKTENLFKRALEIPSDLLSLKKHQNKLMQVVKHNIGKNLLTPFLPDRFDSKLIEVFSLIAKYIDKSKSTGIIEAYDALLAELNEFNTLLENTNTYYSNLVRDSLVHLLINLIKDDFSNNNATKPAVVKLEKSNKKYPLHIEKYSFSIIFFICNNGSGFSHNTYINLISDDDLLSISSNEIDIGGLNPSEIFPVEIQATVNKCCKSATILGELSWNDFDGTTHKQDIDIELKSQNDAVNWDALARKDAYSLEPVENESDLVGRKDLLNRVIAITSGPNIGSLIIHGQKRVGKTSIAKTLGTYLDNNGYVVVYIEGGEYVDPNPEGTISKLGVRICKEIKYSEPKTKNIEIPKFDDALSPLTDFLSEVNRTIDNCNIVIILDEFDELPIDLYIKGVLGDAFFLTLRAICSKKNIGFVLVGSEKMQLILDNQGEKLNKWKVEQIDYFSPDKDWIDYKNLVQYPVINELEYTENAIKSLFEYTCGNPYFTKLICAKIFSTAIKLRDCHITRNEVNIAKIETSREIDKNTFQHFWDDGIFTTGDKAIEKSVNRRRILLALADLTSCRSTAKKNEICEHTIAAGVITPEHELDELASRNVLEFSEGGFSFKVPFFKEWIRERGIHDLIATFSELDSALETKQREEKEKISPSEIVSLSEKWGNYKGISINEDKIKAWIEQFGRPRDQRLIFKILNKLRFYSDSFVREKMPEFYGIIRRELVTKVESRKLKRSDILISYLDGPAKSGAHFARLFAEEAKVLVGNVVEKSQISKRLKKNTDIKALVFLDDFVGTGQSASDYIKELETDIGDDLRNKDIKIFFFAVVAYVKGWKKLEQVVISSSLNISPHCSEYLTESSQCFNAKSEIYPDNDDRREAKRIAEYWGKKLEKKWPLGFGNLELAVVFERGCPNNTLPILWKDSTSNPWRALFKRK